MQFTVQEAKTNLMELIRLALAGEEVVIAGDDAPMVKLTPIPEPRPQRRAGGAAEVILAIAEDFDAPLEEFAEYMA